MAQKFTFSLDKRLCKSCGICVALCPKKLITSGADDKPEMLDTEACVGCGACEIHCPDFAIRIGRKS